MANLYQTASGVWRIRFRFLGRQYYRSLRRANMLYRRHLHTQQFRGCPTFCWSGQDRSYNWPPCDREKCAE